MSSLLGRIARNVSRRALGKDCGFAAWTELDHLLDLDYRYRLESPTVSYSLHEKGEGLLSIDIRPWHGKALQGLIVQVRDLAVTLPCDAQIALGQGVVRVGNAEFHTPAAPMRARRLISDICFVPRGGIQKRRTVMHYLAAAGRPIDTSYFEGDGYIHYENEAPKQAKPVARWIRSYAKPGRVLEVGCAYGYLLEALQRQGWDVWGGDVCSAAVEKASGRVGKERLRTWDAEQEPCPFGGQFDALVLNDVVEHFHEPARALSRLCRLVKAGGEVFIRTANFASASHALWGDDWEGFFDYSHYGISWTTPENVTSLLKSEGFDILECWTEGFWLMNCDPLCQVVAEAYISLECLGEALNTLMRGDFLRVVARKGCP